MSLLPHAAQFEWTISAAALGSAAFYLYVTLEGKKTRQLWDSLLIWFFTFLSPSAAFFPSYPFKIRRLSNNLIHD